ncbi:MAG: cupin domain-containing protein [Gammaproteobacteria bacterium]|nr:cupin domain-containing protein [Gammaproteobacteria bacterium]
MEEVKEGLGRRVVTGERMMLAHWYMARGTVVPLHAHDNEQIAHVLDGALRLWLGEDGDEGDEVTVRSGEVLYIPSGLPHKALALEDTLVTDVFCPPRQDWLDDSDSYLR